MPYTTRGLIDQARSLADLQNTRFISYADELNLINEAYKDIYSRYTESDGDYWSIEVIINADPAQIDPNNQFGYLIPLPADFLKIRSLSYNNGGYWTPCIKFSTSNRDNNPAQPTYRLKNGNLWIIGGLGAWSQLKLDYYPVPVELTAPDVPIALASAETIYNYPLITSYTFDTKDQVFFYTINKILKAESTNTNSTATLFTSTNFIDCINYWAGYIYYRDTTTKIVYRAPTDFTTTIVPVSIKTGVEWFSIQDNALFYTTLTQTRAANLDGSGDVLLVSSVQFEYTLYGPHYVSILGGFLALNGVASTLPATQVRTDGVYLYGLDGHKLNRYNLDEVDALQLLETIRTDVVSLGEDVYSDTLSIVTFDSVEAISLVPNTVLDYPTNEVNEILAYTSAIAYVRKQSDQTKMSLLTGRLAELWDRFWSVNKRDEYSFTRINNQYQNTLNNW